MSDRLRPRAGPQDMLIAGGGIAGLALALAVKRAAPEATLSVYDPSPAGTGRSLRAVAVAAGSRRFLDGLRVWDVIAAQAQPKTGMAITDSRPGDAVRPVFLDFAGEAGPDEPFAHMVFHDDLRDALRAACADCGVGLVSARVTGFHQGGGLLAAETTGDAVRTRLLVAADGGRSRLREAAGIGTVGWDYGQAGIVATISHEVPHGAQATQHFLPAGPLAILPLRAADGTERRVSLVWTTNQAEAERLVKLPPAAFLAELEAAIGHGYGALTLDDAPTAHRLRLVLPRRLVAPRFALLGDAARTIHPLAGQGLNLGLRDAALLAESTAGQLGLGLDPGAEHLLDDYQRARRFDSARLAAATDGLNLLFSNDSLPARLLRDLGLGLVDRMPRLKDLFIREAAGVGPRTFGDRLQRQEHGGRQVETRTQRLGMADADPAAPT